VQVSERFSNDSFPAVSDNGIANSLTCCDSESRMWVVSCGDDDNEVLGELPVTGALDGKEFAPLLETHFSGEAKSS
jgi:hypothetical protein